MNIKKQIKNGISQNQADFLKRHRHHHHIVSFSRFLILCLFLTAWESASSCHLIDPFFFYFSRLPDAQAGPPAPPRPQSVARARPFCRAF